MTVKLLKQSILGQRHDPLMVSLDDTGYYYIRHWNISSTMFVMLLRFVLCVLLRFRKNTQLATVGTHQRLSEVSEQNNNFPPKWLFIAHSSMANIFHCRKNCFICHRSLIPSDY